MKRLLFIMVLVVPTFIGLYFYAIAQDDQDCDLDALQTYLEDREVDTDTINTLVSGDDLPKAYIALAASRQHYEDMTDVPTCAKELNRLTIMQNAVMQDGIFYFMIGAIASPGNTEYVDLLTAVGERLEELNTLTEQELERLQKLIDENQ